MYTYKSSSTVAAIIAILLVGLFTIQPIKTSAQQAYSCIIDGTITAGFDTDLMSSEVSDSLQTVISIYNNTSYYMGGVKTAVGFFTSENDAVPSFTSVSSDDILLSPQSNRTVSSLIDLTALPAGTYNVRVVAFQGDEMDLLGALIHDRSNAFTINKTGSETFDIEQRLTINGQVISSGESITASRDQNITATLRTMNASPLPVMDTPVFVSIVQGDTPLGSAVRSELDDVVRLIPGGYRDSVVTDMFVEDGEYTVYGFLSRSNQATPVMSGKVVVGQDDGPSSWVYISQTGITDFPLTEEGTVTACVEHIGAYEGSTQLLEPVSVSFVLSDGENELFAENVVNSDGHPNKHFSVQPNIPTDNFILTATLLTNRFQSSVIPETGSTSTDNTIEYTEVHSQVSKYECEENCSSEDVTAANLITETDNPSTKPYWFYIAIMLAAALLLYIMLRRLHPEDTGAPADVTDEELQ